MNIQEHTILQYRNLTLKRVGIMINRLVSEHIGKTFDDKKLYTHS